MIVHTRVANEKERNDNKLVIIETEEKVYSLDYRNSFAFISSLKDADSFKVFDDMCKDFKSNKDLEAYFDANNVKY